jgi:hypothetical protein
VHWIETSNPLIFRAKSNLNKNIEKPKRCITVDGEISVHW